MANVSERNFHLLMGVLLVGSSFLDRAMKTVLVTWQPPVVGFVTLVIGLIWVGLFAAHRVAAVQQRMRVVEDRLERSERKIAALETEELARRRSPLL